jgi:FkbM family methyltransferase
MPPGLHQRAAARIGHTRRRAVRTASRLRQRVHRRLSHSWWVRQSPLAMPLTGLRFSAGLYFDGVERMLHALARDPGEVTLVQVGACEASLGDPLGWFLRARGWKGVLVEPVPYLFERVRRNAGGLPGVILENVAIAREEGERTFHYLEPGPGDARPDLYKGIGSFQREILERHAKYIARFEERVVSKPLPCLPLDTLCRRHGLEHLDLLFCDAEGHDFEVLKTLDWGRTPPRLAVWEHKHLSAEDARACRRMLEKRGYDVKPLSKDIVALRRDGTSPALGAAFERL